MKWHSPIDETWHSPIDGTWHSPLVGRGKYLGCYTLSCVHILLKLPVRWITHHIHKLWFKYTLFWLYWKHSRPSSVRMKLHSCSNFEQLASERVRKGCKTRICGCGGWSISQATSEVYGHMKVCTFPWGKIHLYSWTSWLPNFSRTVTASFFY